MARHLRQQGYTVWHEDIAQTASSRVDAGDADFSLVTLLNVLDRCATPQRMLTAAHSLLGPPSASWLLLATPLPFRGNYFGWRNLYSGRPLEPMTLRPGAKDEDEGEEFWTQEAVALLDDVLPTAGFEPV